SSATQTRAPSRAKTSAMPRPMPCPAPVTIATLPASLTRSRRCRRRSRFEPAVERPRPPLVREDRVLDRAPHAPLHVDGDADALHELERLVAVLLLRIRVDFE